MAAVGTGRALVDFDDLEAQKENIEPIRQGRSATSLAKAFSVEPVEAIVEIDRIREGFENEIQASADLDDPLEVWLRYLKWTKEAFPTGHSANSNYVQLLERCSKKFIRAHYANDPRYLKIWIEYARYSDDVREMFCFLARNDIGQELATFYEEYAAFLEVRNRKGQADEIYQLGLLRGARPLIRLKRKYAEFTQRVTANPPASDEPSSPPIGPVRAALTMKLGGLPEGQQRSAEGNGAARPKMQIFTDAEESQASEHIGSGGWGSIGTLQSRRKENTVEVRRMAGEKLPQQNTLQQNARLDIFRDEPTAQVKSAQIPTKPKERVICDLEAVYPQKGIEMSFAELKAQSLGLLGRKWDSLPLAIPKIEPPKLQEVYVSVMDTESPLKDSPRGRVVKRPVASPTINTKAAMDDILGIFSQPLKCEQSDDSSDSDSEEEEPDNTFQAIQSDGTWTQPEILSTADSDYQSDTNQGEDISVHDELDPAPTSQEQGSLESAGVASGIITQHTISEGESASPTIPATPQQQMPQGRANGFDLMTPITEDTENLQISALRSQPLAILKEDEDENLRDELYSSPFIEHPPPRPLLPITSTLQRPALADTMRGRLAAVPRAATASPILSKKGVPITEMVVNPMDNAIRKIILGCLNPQISSYDGTQISNEVSYAKKFEAIEKYIRALNKKAGEATQHLEVILDFSSRYSIRRKLGEGAFAPVFLVENISGVSGHYRKKYEAMKIERPGSAWEFYVMRQIHRRLGVNRACDSIARAHEFCQFSDASFLILDYQDQGTVLDLINMCRSEAGGVDELLAMFITVELLRTVEALHSRGMMHGDLKSDNCLLRFSDVKDNEWSSIYQRDGSAGWQHKGISLIDFGRGIDMKNFEGGVQFISDWKTDEQDCVEMREARPWTYQIDYHGLACISHSLLFGKYIETVPISGSGVGRRQYGLKHSFKRYWKQEIWGPLFDLLLNPQSHGQLPVTDSLKECRERIEGHLEQHGAAGLGIKGLIRKVEIDLALARKRC
ncbi:protein of unknown function [Taphrina deformans PYCC 5710]|uniref:Uncharacterized protein n=1 Tax=Taphrina deformans (strain PYCC 5710 / ATCC 11124 / CBS 356.35 / IMI 108563 / JCM 9778 / NBRC 8474) TaxID=1097556 RepID=R4XLD7_TAPDE|nr:protein of unknown function [Taphrina deformans PYCC 5710]|eukprot:CCG84120.1 protein of unknown function [Taphrina deformans PYCC 5710]